MPFDSTTDDAFARDVLAAEGTVLVDFWAPWCGPCHAVTRTLEDITTRHPGKIRVVKLNADENPLSAAYYRVSSIPALKVFQHGQVVATVIGARPVAALEADLQPYLD